MPLDSPGFVSEWKGKLIDGATRRILGPHFSNVLSPAGIVEQVRDATTLRIRLLMPDGDHQMVNIALAGVKGGRVATKPGEVSEPFAEEVSRDTPCPTSGRLNTPYCRANSLRNLDCFNALSRCKSYPFQTQHLHLSNPSRMRARPPLPAFSSEQVSRVV